VLRHVPTKRQTLFFSATMPPPIAQLTKELLHDPATINMQRVAAPAVGITQAVYPVKQDVKTALFLELLNRKEVKSVIVFCRTKHRANRLADFLEANNVSSAKIHGNRSQAQRTDALAGFKDGRIRVLVATDIVARGIDVEDLSHVINFDVPGMPEDYIHRVGRTARAEATGDAFTFVSPEEENELRDIERAVGKRLPRVTLPDFDYDQKPSDRFEVPVAERIAASRARKAEERARAKAKLERRTQAESGAGASRGRAPARSGSSAGGSSAGGNTTRVHESRPRAAGDGAYASNGGQRRDGGAGSGASTGAGGASGGAGRRRGGRGGQGGGGRPSA
jgi:ATP-dependent RNA helicase RhlE